MPTSHPSKDRARKLNLFPNFQGTDKDNFDNWYGCVLSILATPEWDKLYDPMTHDVVIDEDIHPTLSKYLFSSLNLCVDGNAKKIMVGKRHLRGNGLTYLKALKTMYRRQLPRLLINKKIINRHLCPALPRNVGLTS